MSIKILKYRYFATFLILRVKLFLRAILNGYIWGFQMTVAMINIISSRLTISWPSQTWCGIAESRTSHCRVSRNTAGNERGSSNGASDNGAAVDGTGYARWPDNWAGERGWSVGGSSEDRGSQNGPGQRGAVAQIACWHCGRHWQSCCEENQDAHVDERCRDDDCCRDS